MAAPLPGLPRLSTVARLRLETSPAIAAGLVSVAAVCRAALFFDLQSRGDGLWLLVDLAAAICLAGWSLARLVPERTDGAGHLLQFAALAWAVAALGDTGALRADAWSPFGAATAEVQALAHLSARSLFVAALIIVLPDRGADGFLRRSPAVAAVAGLTVVAGVLAVAGPASAVAIRTPYGFGNRMWVDAGSAVPPAVTAALVIVQTIALLALHRTRRGLPPTSFQVIGWGLVATALPLAFPPLGERLPTGALELLAVAAFPALPVVGVVALLRTGAALGRTVGRLRRSQQLMVEAVESERRRLRQELHDGLGPALAGIALGVRAAGSAVAEQAPATARLLERLATETESSLEEVRRIVYDLRPPTLDQLGLSGAIAAHAQRCCSSADGPRLELSISELPRLPAGVELAAYRIALEAITNAVRHARASSLVVRLEPVGDELIVEVDDNGNGLPADLVAGVGVVSMRERAESVGGQVVLSLGAAGGTSVRAVLPVTP